MQKLAHQTLVFDDFVLDLTRGCLLRDGQEVKLRPKSFETLKHLVENNGRLVSKNELMAAVWPDSFVTDDSLVQCLRDVRRALGDRQSYIKTVPRRGYMFETDVISNSSVTPRLVYAEQVESVSVVIEEAERHPTEETKPQESKGIVAFTPDKSFWNRKTLTFSLLLFGIALVLSYFWISSKTREVHTGGSLGVRSIAVLPFKPLSTDGSDEYLGLGMADTLITKLSGTKEIIVRPTSAVQRYSSSDHDSLASGREQKVDAVLEGSIQRSGDRVRVTVRLIRVQDGSTLWGYQYDEYFGDIFAVQDAISEKVAGALELKLTGEAKRQLAKRYTDNIEAHQLYVKGVFLRSQMTEEGLKKSIGSFQQAIELDPNYALAYVGQASTYSPLAYLGHIPVRDAELKNRQLIARGLELDDSLAEAHAALGELKLFIEWDWEGAEREFKRALELNPNEQLTHLLYPDLLLIKGRPEEAIAMSKLALENDPLSPRTGKALAWVSYFAGQYDQAIEQGNKTLELFPGYPLINLGPSYERKGMNEQALKEYLAAATRSGIPAGEIAALQQAYSSAGWRGYWQKRLNLALGTKGKPVQSVFLAELYARIGEHDQALKSLEKAYEERNMSLMMIKVDPIWDSFRADPRFRDLLGRMHLQS